MKDRATKIGLWLISAILIGVMAMGFIAYSCEKTETASAAEWSEEKTLTTTIQLPKYILNGVTYSPDYDIIVTYNFNTSRTTLQRILNGIPNIQPDGAISTITAGQSIPMTMSYNNGKTNITLTFTSFNTTALIQENITFLSSVVVISGTKTKAVSALQINWVKGEESNTTSLVSWTTTGVTSQYEIITNNLPTYEQYKYISESGENNNQIYQAGYKEGSQAGYDNAYSQLYESRYNAGYTQGKIDGIESANEYTFLGLLNAVFYAPLKAFVSMLNFEILGVNILTFVTALLTLAVVTTLIKVVL